MADLELGFAGKKKRRNKNRVVDEAAEQECKESEGEGYEWLLQRAMRMIHSGRGSVETITKATFPTPRVGREGTRRTVWTNYGDFCRRAHRQEAHLLRFVASELRASCSLTADSALNMRARISAGQVETICHRYIHAYVLCSNCKGLDTLLERDNVSRLTFISCQTCRARKSVTNVKEWIAPRKAQTEIDMAES